MIKGIVTNGRYVVKGKIKFKEDKGVTKFKIYDGEDIKKDAIYGIAKNSFPLEEKESVFVVKIVKIEKEVKHGEIIATKNDLLNLINNIKKEQYKEVALDVITQKEEDLINSISTQMSAYSYKGGLYENLINTLKLTIETLPKLEEIYNLKIDKDIVLLSAIFSDLGKVMAFKDNQKTKEGWLLGDSLLSLKELYKYADKLDNLLEIEHIINSAKGELGYGAITIPRTPEAIAFSQIKKLEHSFANIVFMKENNIDTLFKKKYVLEEEN